MGRYVYRGADTVDRAAALADWNARQVASREAYRRHRRFVEWMAREPWASREAGRRYANAIDTAPDLDSVPPQD